MLLDEVVCGAVAEEEGCGAVSEERGSAASCKEGVLEVSSFGCIVVFLKAW